MSQKERLFPVYSLSRVLQRSTHCHRLKGKEAVLSPNYETFRNHYFWQHCVLCEGQDGASKDEAKSKQGHLLMTGWVLSARILCQKYCQTGTVAVAHFLFIQMKTTKWWMDNVTIGPSLSVAKMCTRPQEGCQQSGCNGDRVGWAFAIDVPCAVAQHLISVSLHFLHRSSAIHLVQLQVHLVHLGVGQHTISVI